MDMIRKNNPVIYSDFPDPDLIRVGDTYYMASTTMHFMPGCDILRSRDLVNWELIAHAYDELENTPAQRMQQGNIYGRGMWAPSLRYHNGTFFLCFVANDTGKTYLYTAENPEGPWKKQYIRGFYHDSSLLFDDNGRVYILYGNTEIRLTELSADLSGPKPGGLNRIVAVDRDNVCLGFEGSHLYKRDGKYYAFFCHWPNDGTHRKNQVCFVADSLEGEFRGGCVLDDDLSYHNLGVAQGGMVDTPDGRWYAFLFQDRGALGRAPVLVPMHFENNFPVLGENGRVPAVVSVPAVHADISCAPLYGSDDFDYHPDADGRVKLKLFWQFNHIPDNRLWSVTERPHALRLHTGSLCVNPAQARNTLTQRTMGPESSASVTVDGSRMKDGDVAGISAFQGCYGCLALIRENGRFYLSMTAHPARDGGIGAQKDDAAPPVEYERIPAASPQVTLKVKTVFEDHRDEAAFFYRDGNEWKPIGIVHRLYFKLDHFCGCRFALFLYATHTIGGSADFMNFQYLYGKNG